MDIGLLLALLLQVGCALLASRLGRPQLWVQAVLMVPLAGSLVYAALEWRRYRRTRLPAEAPLEPDEAGLDAALGGWRYRLCVDPTYDRRTLAEECLRRGRAADAVLLYRSCLDGRGSTDLAVIRGLRQAKAVLAAPPAAVRPAESELPLSA